MAKFSNQDFIISKDDTDHGLFTSKAGYTGIATYPAHYGLVTSNSALNTMVVSPSGNEYAIAYGSYSRIFFYSTDVPSQLLNDFQGANSTQIIKSMKYNSDGSKLFVATANNWFIIDIVTYTVDYESEADYTLASHYYSRNIAISDDFVRVVGLSSSSTVYWYDYDSITKTTSPKNTVSFSSVVNSISYIGVNMFDDKDIITFTNNYLTSSTKRWIHNYHISTETWTEHDPVGGRTFDSSTLSYNFRSPLQVGSKLWTGADLNNFIYEYNSVTQEVVEYIIAGIPPSSGYILPLAELYEVGSGILLISTSAKVPYLFEYDTNTGDLEEIALVNGPDKAKAAIAFIYSGGYQVTGSITESLVNETWMVNTYDPKDGAMMRSDTVTGSTFDIKLSSSDPVMITVSMPTPDTWDRDLNKKLDDLVVATDIETNPVYFKCTTAGITDVTEPVWNTTINSTTADGTVIWTCVERLIQPVSHGPIIPTLIP